MDEPRDDIDTWLQERVTPLLPHPGSFEQIRRRARRRKAGRAALTAAGAVVVLAGAITVPRLILSGGFGGTPTAQIGSATPVQQFLAGTSPADRHRHLGARRPHPRHPRPRRRTAVPANFAASSVTFVSTSTGWVIGQAGTPGHCGPPKLYDCTSVAATDDGGSTWHGVPAPVTGAPDGGTGVSQIRSLNGVSAWAFGPQLYATHDSGAKWRQIPTHGMRVTDLETVNGLAFAVWARCASTGADFAADCTSVLPVLDPGRPRRLVTGAGRDRPPGQRRRTRLRATGPHRQQGLPDDPGRPVVQRPGHPPRALARGQHAGGRPCGAPVRPGGRGNRRPPTAGHARLHRPGARRCCARARQAGTGRPRPCTTRRTAGGPGTRPARSRPGASPCRCLARPPVLCWSRPAVASTSPRTLRAHPGP